MVELDHGGAGFAGVEEAGAEHDAAALDEPQLGDGAGAFKVGEDGCLAGHHCERVLVEAGMVPAC